MQSEFVKKNSLRGDGDSETSFSSSGSQIQTFVPIKKI